MKNGLKVLVMAFAVIALLAGCSTSEVVETVPEIVVPAPAPVVEAPAPAPVVEEAAPVQESAAVEPITGTLSYAGYTVSYSAVPGKAEVTYPSFITDEEISAFFAYKYSNNAQWLEGVYFEVTAPGQMVITFPESVTVADATAVVNLMLADLNTFLAEYLA